MSAGRGGAATMFWAGALSAALALPLGGCATLDITSAAQAVGFSESNRVKPGPSMVQVFIASTRKSEHGPDAQKTSTEGPRYALATLTIPPGHKPGSIEQPMWGSGNAKSDIVVQSQRDLDSDEFKAELASHVSGRVGVNRDVLIFVHGFNTNYDEARLRAAQVAADSHFGGVPVLFTWPSQNAVLGYVYDKDSATASRDALQDLIAEISATPGVGKIHVLAHSMGGWLAMEALRQSAIAGHRDLDGHLGEVMLASPDIDMDVFASQMAKLRPAKVTVFATANDRALSLSSTLAQARQRVGAINPANPADRAKVEALGAQAYDLSSYSDGFIDHGAYAVTPDVLHAIGAQMATPRASETGTVSIIDASGYADKPQN